MSAADLAAVVVVIVAVVACAACVAVAWQLHRAARQLRASASALRGAASELTVELRALSGDTRRSVRDADAQLERAAQVVAAMEQASRLTYRTMASPVIKAAAVASGVRRGAGRLRHGADGAARNGRRPDDESELAP
jgi:hypothetical protein